MKAMISVPVSAEGFFHGFMDRNYPDVDFGFAGTGAHTTGVGTSWVGSYRRYEITGDGAYEVAEDVHWAIEHHLTREGR